jgi:AcrR family transcriptional regulator
MARPSQDLDQALLRSGRELFAASGCEGLSLRALADHAGVNVGMFHYHFKSKDNFLRTLLQQMYEEVFTLLSVQAAQEGAAVDRLRHALCALGRFVRVHRSFVARVWSDAANGQSVAREFVRANAPRHLSLLLGLMAQAEQDGDFRGMPPLQRFVFVMGAVAAPMFIAPVVADIGIAGELSPGVLDAQVMSDAAIAARVDMALGALRAVPAQPSVRAPAQARRARTKAHHG